ncbi:hypothetical protein [Desulfobacula toluolica]|uniref:Uncharacterized protein n=1 Tax=Desulfobacula toluolica (strain DSM 7467 / Tol2) TaxID=651182 RepID=K0NL92_DESTT|nr:hypothetical protein [Desulfobacula toluolica]CCK80758.1 uncharacterized protein TOL2_C25990 [Desulfobacula toluolica Tol2]
MGEKLKISVWEVLYASTTIFTPYKFLFFSNRGVWGLKRIVMSQTEVLAIWGAVTGTIGTVAGLLGLWLRFRQHGLDKTKLLCESSFGFNSPNQPLHKLTIRSIGRRPVTIDNIRYFITPRDWKQRLTKPWQHKNGRWLWHQEPKQKAKLGEGEKTEISISLPDGIAITEIYKVEVIDQAGKAWPVNWQGSSRLQKLATQDTLDELTKENDKRLVSATGYRLGEKFFLETKFNTKPGRTGIPCGRGFWFLDAQKYQEKLKSIKDVQFDKFLTGEIEELT